MIDLDALILAGLRGDAKAMNKQLPVLIAELRRLQEVERCYDQFLQDATDITAAVMREFPGSTHTSSIAR